jgi:predicted O-linked N-acetylglucosamine transferase (SPINDLY family)
MNAMISDIATAFQDASVLSCAGDAFAARMAGSLLRAVGLPELVTERLDEYEANALDLAQRPQELDSLRRRLDQNRRSSPLFDTDRLRRHLEAAYEMMRRRTESGEQPAAFEVHEQDESLSPRL